MIIIFVIWVEYVSEPTAWILQCKGNKTKYICNLKGASSRTSAWLLPGILVSLLELPAEFIGSLPPGIND